MALSFSLDSDCRDPIDVIDQLFFAPDADGLRFEPSEDGETLDVEEAVTASSESSLFCIVAG
jgi:hypothetical protein